MITLITGLPGAGKTLNTLELVETECPDRQVYYSGIEALTLDWQLIDENDLNKWDTFPDGSVFVIDEVQRIWPGIPNNQKSPEAVMKLDTHRHRGFDFYFITQSPTLTDHRMRKFVGRHIHFERAMGLNMFRRVTFQKVANDPENHFARKEAEISVRKHNKKYYNKYKSATMHTVKRRVSWKVWAALAAPVLLLVGALNFGMDFVNRSPAQISESHPMPFEDLDLSRRGELPLNPEQYAAQFTPRIADVPHSAPAYDELTIVKTYPRPQCIHRIQLKSCKCYSQQATPLDISFNRCLSYVKNGWFNPYRDEEAERERDRERASALAALSARQRQRDEETEHKIIYIGESENSYIGQRRAF